MIERFSAELQAGLLAPVGEESAVSDTHEALGDDVQQEAADELLSRERHRLDLIDATTIAIGEGYLAITNREDPVVCDRHAVGVAAQIVEDLFWSGKGPL